MTSFKLIFRNVHKNIRDYLIYFLTLTLSVSLFYAFNSISDQPAFSDMGITGSLLYDQLGILLSALSVIIAVVLAFLIIYANQFLLKRRKKELGVYMVLGMKKRRISRLFAGETLGVGVIALVSGLVLGLLFSQGLSLVALKLFAIELDKFQIVFSAGAFRQTVLCFQSCFGYAGQRANHTERRPILVKLQLHWDISICFCGLTKTFGNYNRRNNLTACIR